MQHTYFVLHFVPTRGGTSPDGVEMTLIRERKSTDAAIGFHVSVMSLSTLLCGSSGCPEIGEEPNHVS